MNFKLTFLLFFITLFSFAQKATITGVVSDKDLNNEPLPFANVNVKGKTIGTTTDVTGKYKLEVPAGNHVLVFSFLGYLSKEVAVSVSASDVKVINESLGTGSVKMEDVVVKTTQKGRESESALLLEQKKAVDLKQSIGAQELSKKGVGDAAAAVAKVTGVSQQEGVKNVVVRGLGDRYNSTSLNGLPLPSEDPEYKNISLKFFTTSIIKNININKTFSGDLYGDVAGANIDIVSKDLEKGKILTISAGSGFNSNSLNTRFIIQEEQNYFGKLKNGDAVPITNLSNYTFENSFRPKSESDPINNDFSIIAGKKFNFGENKSITLFGVAINSSEYSFKQGDAAQVGSDGSFRQNMKFKKYIYNASQSFLGNIKYKFGNNSSIALNSLYIKDNTQSLGDYSGFSTSINDNNDEDGLKSFIRRQQVNHNILFSNQLLVNYNISPKLNVNVSGGYNTTNGSEPDRRTNSYLFANNNYNVSSNSPGLNHRFFSTLEETDLVGKAEVSYKFTPDAELTKKLTVGANARITERRFDFTQFNFDFADPDIVVDINNPDAVFNQAGLNLGRANRGFDMVTGRGIGSDALNPFYYEGNREIMAGYALFNYPINEKLTVLANARFENVTQEVIWDTNLSSSVTNLAVKPSLIEDTYILPSLVVKYDVNEKNSIRLAASQTYTLPQFKETAPFLYEDINFASFGNPYLESATNLNFDVKYDWYLSKNEIVSLGAFYKQITDPINRVRVASAANELSYVNTGDAMATGVEFELRKSLFSTENNATNKNLSFGLNVSYLYSNQKLVDNPNDKLTVLFTNPEDRLEGASPLLINSDISYNFFNDRINLTSTLVFNYFMDRIYSLGTAENENLVEKAVPTLDFVNKFDIIKGKFGISATFRNVLNPSFKITQETVLNNQKTEKTVNSFKKGVFGSFGVYWNL